MCQRAAGRSRRVRGALLTFVQSALLAFYLADLDDLWSYQHVLGELRFEVAARRAVLAAELGSDFASADLRLTLLQRSSGRRLGLGLGLGEG